MSSDKTQVNGQTNLAFVSDEYGGGGQQPPYNGQSVESNGKPENGEVADGDTVVILDDPNAPERQNWDSPIEFLLSCVAMSVGLGNLWRFPFVALSNGGGAFLIPYLIVLLVIGRPMYFMEMCLGQFCSKGQIKAWKMAPIFKGIGYTSAFATFAVCTYYSVLIAITVIYFFASFAKNLPWAECNPDWGIDNVTCAASPALFYFTKDAVPQIEKIDDGLGTPNWRLSLGLLFAWLFIAGTIIRGVKSSGKVAYFTALFPYIVLFILLIRGVTLEGAGKGIAKFFEPKWESLYDPKVWYAAVGQCFFSLNVGFGPIIMFSSYNPFKHNVSRDALIISFMDTFTSLLAGVTIFSILGYLAHIRGAEIEEVAGTGGAALAFIAYPSAIAAFDWVPQLFAVLFFLMLFTLGLGSATALSSSVITIICDAFPKLKQWQVTIAFAVVTFLIGLVYVTPGGLHILDLVDNFAANFVIYVAALLEVGAIAYVYGLGNFCKDIEFMLETKVNIYYRVCWYAIPFLLGGVLIYWAVTYESPIPIENGYTAGSQIAGWLLAIVAVSLIVVFGLHSVLKDSNVLEKFRQSLRPKEDWGPLDPKTRREWLEFKAKSN